MSIPNVMLKHGRIARIKTILLLHFDADVGDFDKILQFCNASVKEIPVILQKIPLIKSSSVLQGKEVICNQQTQKVSVRFSNYYPGNHQHL